jgi:protein SCO1/2
MAVTALRYLLVHLILALLLVAEPVSASLGGSALFAHESQDLARDVARANAAGKSLLVMFETADCGYCADMRRKVFVRSNVREFYLRHFVTVSVRLDVVAPLPNPLGAAELPAELARRYGLAGTPGFAFLDRQGRLIARHQGALASPAEFVALGRYVLAGAYETQPFAAWRLSHADDAFHSGVVVAQPPLDFTFSDAHGRLHRLKDLRGQVVVLAFGYTQCPDVCPTTLTEMKELLARLGSDASRVRLVFISVDGERDTPAMLGIYTAAFDARILPGVIDAAQIRRLTQSVGLVVERQTGGASYSVDHSSGYFILDPQGRLRLRSDYGQDTASVLADLRRLLAANGKLVRS